MDDIHNDKNYQLIVISQIILPLFDLFFGYSKFGNAEMKIKMNILTYRKACNVQFEEAS